MVNRRPVTRFLDRQAFRIALARAKISLVGVSRELGIPYDRLTKLSSGTRPARIVELERLACLLGVTVDDLAPSRLDPTAAYRGDKNAGGSP